jgi:hypothetical protein
LVVVLCVESGRVTSEIAHQLAGPLRRHKVLPARRRRQQHRSAWNLSADGTRFTSSVKVTLLELSAVGSFSMHDIHRNFDTAALVQVVKYIVKTYSGFYIREQVTVEVVPDVPTMHLASSQAWTTARH